MTPFSLRGIYRIRDCDGTSSALMETGLTCFVTQLFEGMHPCSLQHIQLLWETGLHTFLRPKNLRSALLFLSLPFFVTVSHCARAPFLCLITQQPRDTVLPLFIRKHNAMAIDRTCPSDQSPPGMLDGSAAHTWFTGRDILPIVLWIRSQGYGKTRR
jgi:hypothetical protein